MKQEWIVTWVSVLLIIVLFFYLDITKTFTLKKDIAVADVIGALSALAAAVAAWASWKAASIARRSAEDNNAFARAQLYIKHRSDFVELLDYVGQELGVIFYKKTQLYSKLFPLNHYSGAVFDSKGDEAIFGSWMKKYNSIVNRTDRALDDKEFELWISDSIVLLAEIQYENKPQEGPQICFWAFTEHPMPTGFFSSPARNIFNISEVINRIGNFCGRERVEQCFLEGHPFESHYTMYFDSIDRGHTDHYVGVAGQPMVPKKSKI